MTFASEGEDWSRKIHSNLLLLGIESNTLSDMAVARKAPDVERILESDDQDTLI